MQQFSPGEFAEAMQKISELKQTKPGQLRPDDDDDAGEFITLRVRPGRRPGRATRNHGMYSPMTKEEADQVRSSMIPSHHISRRSLSHEIEINTNIWYSLITRERVGVQSGAYFNLLATSTSQGLRTLIFHSTQTPREPQTFFFD